MEAGKHSEDAVEVIEFDEDESVSDGSNCSGEELDFDPSKDLWVTVTVAKPRNLEVEEEERWNWEVICYCFAKTDSWKISPHIRMTFIHIIH